MSNLIKCHLNDPMVPGGKTGFAEPPADGQKHEVADCCVCGSTLEYVREPGYSILAVACSTCDPEWIKRPRLRIAVQDEESMELDEESLMEDEEANATILDDAPAEAASRPSAPTEACEACEACGGPKRGRGYTHNEDCSAIKKAPKAPKVAKPAAEPLPPCEYCGGPKRGRGYTHVQGCSSVKPSAAKTGGGRRPRI